jgi:pimeloyl-ACP methyl ester carboxylesterase
MTHGVGFDRSYWDPPINDYKYSYVARAVDDHGYSTLTWDRLGVGKSSHGETINEIQIFLEIAALAELTRKFVNCTVCEHSYKRVVHLGHSFGSAMTYGLVNQYPDISNGIVLTGFSQIPAYMGLFALGGNFVPVSSIPSLASQYAEGYVAAGSKSAVHTNFFGPNDFDPAVLDWLYEHGQANTPGEILTVGATGGVANVFHGPSLVITGGKTSKTSHLHHKNIAN